MAFSLPQSSQLLSRRGFLKAGLYGAAGLALYSGEIARHWIEVTRHNIVLNGLPAPFIGMRIAQISDIHMDDFTEPFFLRHAIDIVNRDKPDAVFLTGDFITAMLVSHAVAQRFDCATAWHCAGLLTGLECKQRYAVLGNHDFGIAPETVAEPLAANGITVLRNACLPIERSGSRIWLAGLDDPLSGHPKPDLAIPPSVRNQPNEPVILLCHGPDYADHLLAHPAGQAVDFMLSGHTHGGQIRLPFVQSLALPPMGRKYVEGLFRFGRLQLYVNRGLGTIGLPFRINCPPEVSFFTLRDFQPV